MFIEFSTTQVMMLFRDAGLEIKFQDMPVDFSVDPDNPRLEIVPALTVINPYTGKPEIAKDLFEKYLRFKIKNIILPADKLEIYKLFQP